MGKLKFLWPLIKANVSIGVAITAFYLGAHNYHLVDRIQHNLFRKHLEYAQYSHSGSLKVDEIENSQGKLEKKLRNLETDEFLYTIRPDCLPDNDFVYKGLEKRIESYDDGELAELYRKSTRLKNLLRDRLYGKMAVSEKSINPLKLGVIIQVTEKGKLEALLQYGHRVVKLTEKDFGYLADGNNQFKQDHELSSQDKTKMIQADNPGSVVVQSQQQLGANNYMYLGIIGLLGIAGWAYRGRNKG